MSASTLITIGIVAVAIIFLAGLVTFCFQLEMKKRSSVEHI